MFNVTFCSFRPIRWDQSSLRLEPKRAINHRINIAYHGKQLEDAYVHCSLSNGSNYFDEEQYARCWWHLMLHIINVEKNVSRFLFHLFFHYLCLQNLGLVGVGCVWFRLFVCFFVSLFVVVVYLSFCFQFNRKLPFEKYSAALFYRR